MTIIDDYLSLTNKYKKEYGERTLLLMQVGSFFECYALLNDDSTYYGSDIQNFSEINDMVISKKNTSHNGIPVVMAGFGLNQLEKYVKKLQEKDYTIVVYTQDAQTKNTTRSLSCIYSPGTYFSNDSNSISNVTSCIWIHYSSSNKCINEKVSIGLASIDIYTGYSNLFEYSLDYIKGPGIFDELETYLNINNPSECIVISNKNFEHINDFINCKKHSFDYTSDWVKNVSKQKYQQEIIKTFFNNEMFIEWNVSTQCYCFLIQFIYKHNPNLIKKLRPPIFENSNNKLTLANHSLKQLNIISDSRYTGKLSSISSLLNNCITTIGKRAFNYSLLNPKTDHSFLIIEYNITEHILNKNNYNDIRGYLQSIKDISKIYRKMILNKFNPKDFWIIYNTVNFTKLLFEYLHSDSVIMEYISNNEIDVICLELMEYINSSLVLENCKLFEDLSMDKISNKINELMFFTKECSPEVYKKYHEYSNATKKLESIKDLFNNFIKTLETKDTKDSEFIKIYETPKSEPTLVGTTRRLNILKKNILDMNTDLIDLSTIEIKSHNGSNSMIISAEILTLTKSIIKLKEKYFKSIVEEFYNYSIKFISQFEEKIEIIISFIIKCDTLQNKCYIADKYNYCKPTLKIEEDSFLEFEELRHPLIEQLNTDELYISNSINMGKLNYLLYGTNAVGKTSFIKSIGISIIMAQSGLYVPAKSFTYSVYTNLFTRILGNDNIFKGLSTFAVEMVELRNILKYSNRNSLILGDELCSGTESTSALSIFTAGIDFLSKLGCSFIFATHFHEILNYSEIKTLSNVKCIHMSVIYNKKEDKLIYDRKIKDGPGDNMYGLEVCKSLNLPDPFLELAHDIRMKYSQSKAVLNMSKSKYNSKKIKGICEICKEVQGTEVHHLVYQKNAKKIIKNHKANLINICETCHDLIHLENKELKIYKTTKGYEII